MTKSKATADEDKNGNTIQPLTNISQLKSSWGGYVWQVEASYVRVHVHEISWQSFFQPPILYRCPFDGAEKWILKWQTLRLR